MSDGVRETWDSALGGKVGGRMNEFSAAKKDPKASTADKIRKSHEEAIAAIEGFGDACRKMLAGLSERDRAWLMWNE